MITLASIASNAKDSSNMIELKFDQDSNSDKSGIYLSNSFGCFSNSCATFLVVSLRIEFNVIFTNH